MAEVRLVLCVAHECLIMFTQDGIGEFWARLLKINVMLSRNWI